MTPMIDVVFLLIIFFLVSSHLARQESRVPLDLPTAASHLPFDTQPATLTIHVLATGEWNVAGEIVDPQRLALIFTQQQQKHGAGAIIRIRTDGLAPYRRVEPILRAAAIAGLANISLAVYESTTQPGGGR